VFRRALGGAISFRRDPPGEIHPVHRIAVSVLRHCYAAIGETTVLAFPHMIL
jgi:hypothetical protein